MLKSRNPLCILCHPVFEVVKQNLKRGKSEEKFSTRQFVINVGSILIGTAPLKRQVLPGRICNPMLIRA